MSAQFNNYQLAILDTTDSSTVSSGALLVAGGVGINKNLTIGGSITASAITAGSISLSSIATGTISTTGIITAGGGLSVAGNATFGSSSVVTISNPTDSSSAGAGALQVTGGIYAAKSVYVGTVLGFGTYGAVTANTSTGWSWDMQNASWSPRIQLQNSKASGQYATNFILHNLGQAGALNQERLGITVQSSGYTIDPVATGSGVKRSLTIYGGTVHNTDGTVLFTNSSIASSTTSGAVQVTGGVGIGGALYVGGNIYMASNLVATQSYVASLGYLSVATAASTYQPLLTAGTGLTLSGNTLSVNAAQPQITSVGTLTFLTSSGVISTTSATASTGTTSGALQVTGGAGIGGALYVGGNIYSGGNQVATQSYVLGLGYLTTSGAASTYQPLLTAGTGLTLSGNTLSVNATQSQITSVGTLTSLSSSGVISTTSATAATGTTSGALQVTGGAGIGGALYVGGNIYMASNLVATQSYVASLGYLTVAVAASTYQPLLTAGTGLTLSGNTFSVNAAQSQITSVGILTALASSGIISTTLTTDATSATTSGALQIAGGASIGNSLYVGGNIYTNNLPVATQAYVAAQSYLTTTVAAGTYQPILSAGSGISISSNTVTVTAAQPTITSLGILTSLTSGGSVSFTSATDSTATTGLSGAVQITGGVTIAKTLNANQVRFLNTGTGLYWWSTSSPSLSSSRIYDDSNLHIWTDDNIYLDIGGTGNTSGSTTGATNVMKLVSASVSVMVTTTVGTTVNATTSSGGALNVAGDLVLGATNPMIHFPKSGINTPTLTNRSAGTKLVLYPSVTASFVDYAIGIETVSMWHSIPASGNNFKWYAGTTNIMTLAGTGALSITGSFSQSTSTINDSTTVASGTNATLFNYAGFTAPTLTATNTGVTRTTASTLYVSGAPIAGINTTITNSYALQVASGQTVFQDATAASSTTTGALQVVGGMGIGGALYTGGNIYMSGVLVATQSYVIGLGYLTVATAAGTYQPLLTAGTGLTLSSNTLSVNAAQTQITSVGTLTSLTSSGVISSTSATPATSSTSGALQVVGGAGIGGALYTGGNVVITSDTATSGTGSGALQVTGGAGITGKLITGSDIVSGRDYYGATGGFNIYTSTTNRGLSVNSGGDVSLTSTTDTVSIASGALQIPGGVGVAKSLYVGANVTALGTTVLSGNLSVAGTATFTSTVTVPTPVNPTDACTKAYADALYQGLSIKNSVVAASIGPVILTTLATGSTLDGVTLATGNRILLKDQTTGTENGIYIIGASGPPTRSADLATGSNGDGAFTFVEQGTVNAYSGWVVTNAPGSATVGTNALGWSQFSAAGQIVAGNGLVKSGNQIAVNVDGSSIEINNDTLRIASTALGTGLSGGSGVVISVAAAQPQITSVGTLTALVSSGVISTTSGTAATGTTSGALQVTGGAGIGGALYVGGNVYMSGGLVATQSYVTGLGYLTTAAAAGTYQPLLTAGTGLTLSGNTLSVNAAQTQITSVGTLTGLSSSGVVGITSTSSIGATVNPTSATGGALNITGDVTIGANAASQKLFFAQTTGTYLGAPTFTNRSVGTRLVLYPGIASTTGDYALGIENNAMWSSISQAISGQSFKWYAGTTNVMSLNGVGNLSITASSGTALSVSNSTTTATNVIGAFLQSSLATSNYNEIELGVAASSMNSALFNFNYVGSGNTGNYLGLGLYALNGVLRVYGTGVVMVNTTTDSISTTSGAFQVKGGAGIAASLYVGSYINQTTSTINDAATAASGTNATSLYYTTHNAPTLTATNTGVTRTNASTVYISGAPIAGTNTTITNAYALLVASGKVVIQDASAASSTTSGAMQVVGGAGIGGALYVGGNIYMSGVLVATQSYVTGLGYLTNATAAAIYQPLLSAGTGLTLSGNTLSVNASQTQITAVGTLSAMTSTGVISTTLTTDATSATGSGALQIAGGAGIGESLYVGNNIYMAGALVATQSYISGLGYLTSAAAAGTYQPLLSAGTGLTLSGNTLSVNTSQTQITSVGTLTALASSGVISTTSGTAATGTTSGALQVTGGAGIGGALYVGSNIYMSGSLVATQSYVAGLGYLTSATAASTYQPLLTAGTGLTLAGSSLSVNAVQTQITSVGTLTALTSSGVISTTSGTAATSATSGALQITGGAGIGGALYVGGSIYMSGALVATQFYVTGLGYLTSATAASTYQPLLTAGTGLTLTGNTLSVNAAQTQITSVGTLTALTSSGIISTTSGTASTGTTSGALQVSGGAGIGGALYVGGNIYMSGTLVATQSYVTGLGYLTSATAASTYQPLLTAGTGLTLSANTLSVNAAQTQITSVGTLTSVTSSGGITLSGASPVIQSTNATGPLTIDPNHTTNNYIKLYDDARVWGNFSVYDTLGSKQWLGVSTTTGTMSLYCTTDSSSTITGGLQIAGGVGISKSLYVGSLINQATSTINDASTAASGTNSGALYYTTYNAPTLTATNTGVVRTTASTVYISGAPIAGTNTTITNTFALLVASGKVVIQDSSVATGTTTGAVQITGGASIGGALYVGGNIYSAGVQVATQSYVTGLGYLTSAAAASTYQPLLSAGTGLTLSSNTLSVNASQTQITSVGTLTAVGSTGIISTTLTTDATTATGTGALQIAGGAGIGGTLYVGGNIYSGGVQVATQSYVTGLGYLTSATAASTYQPLLTAGTGLTLSGNTLSVNAAQTQITSVGTLTSLTSSGVISTTSGTAATGTTSGALQVTGGAGIGGALYVGGNIYSGGVQVATQSYVTGLGYLTSATAASTYQPLLTAGTGLTLSGSTLSVNAAQTQITSVGTLTSLSSSGVISTTSGTAATSTTSGALQVTGGAGIGGALYVGGNIYMSGALVATQSYVTGLGYLTSATAASTYQPLLTAGTGLTLSANTLSVNAAQTQITSVGTLTSLTSSGVISTTSGTAATSTTSGALQVIGGAGIGGALYVGGNIYSGGVQVATQSYVTGLGYLTSATAASTYQPLLTAGTGLTLSANTLSVNAAQSQITSVGTLNLVASSGVISTTLTTDATSATATGALQIAGGASIGNSLYVGGNIYMAGALVATQSYVTGLGYLTSATAASTYQPILSAGSGISISSNTLSVTAAQPTITSLGTLTSLTSSGAVSFTSATDSTATTGLSGAVQITGGVTIAKTLNANQARFLNNGSGLYWINAPATASVSRIYDDANLHIWTDDTVYIDVGGTGNTSGGSTGATNVMKMVSTSVSVMVTTTVGTTVNATTSSGGALNVAGDVVLGATNPMIHFPKSGINVPTFTNRSAGTKLVLYPSVTASNVDYAIGIETTSLWNSVPTSAGNFKWYAGTTNVMTLAGTGTLSITGSLAQSTSTVNDSTTAASGTNATLFSYAAHTAPTLTATNTGVTRTTASTLYVSGAPIAGINTTITNAYALQIAAGQTIMQDASVATGTTSGALQVTGGVGIGGALYVGGNIYMGGVQVATQSYVTGLGYLTSATAAGTYQPLLTAGTGLTLAGNTLSVNAAQTQITSVGTLLSLTSSGVISSTLTTDATDISGSGALQVAGGVGIIKSAFIGGHLVTNTDLTIRAYGGEGGQINLAYAGNTALVGQSSLSQWFIDVNNLNQFRIVDCNASGSVLNAILINNTTGEVILGSTTASTSTTSGALQVSGGMGIGGTVYAGGNIYMAGVLVATQSYVTGQGYLTSATAASTYQPLLTAGTGLTLAGNTLSVNAAQSQITSVGNLSSLSSSGVISTSLTTDATAATGSGALQIAGGAGIGASLFIGGLFNQSTSTILDSTTTASGTNATVFGYSSHFAPTLTAVNTGVVQTTASTLYVSGAPIAGTNTTITNPWALQIASGKSIFQDTTDATPTAGGAVQVSGGLSVTKSMTVGTTSTTNTTMYVLGSSANFRFTTSGSNCYIQSGTALTTGSTAPLYFSGINGSPVNAILSATGFTVNNATTSGGVNSASFMSGSLVGAANNANRAEMSLGVAQSTNNTALFDFNYIGAGSTSNSLGLGFWGGNNKVLIYPTGVMSVITTTDATSTTSGVLQVAGGAGIAGTLYVGYGLNVTNVQGTGYTTAATFLQPAMAASAAGTNITIGRANTSYNCGQFTFYSVGASSTSNYCKIQISNQQNGLAVRGDGIVLIDSTTDSSSSVTGALQVAGGAGIGRNLYVGGAITATGDITAFSDARLKRNVETITDATEKVNRLRGVSFEHISTGEESIGLIAQEVREILPELVKENVNVEGGENEDMGPILSIAYGNMVGLLVECIKELTARIKVLEQKIETGDGY